MARVTGEDAAAGLPDEMTPPEDVDLDLYDPSPAALATKSGSSASEPPKRSLSKPLDHQLPGKLVELGEGSVLLASTRGFLGSYRTSSVSLSVVPQAGKNGQLERDYWYTTGRGLSDLETPEEVGRIAAERTLRRLGATQVPTCQVPVVFDPETAVELMGAVFSALSGYAVFPQRHLPQGTAPARRWPRRS